MALGLFKNKNSSAQLSLQDVILPEHIGIIMDGNGRWAKMRGLPRSAGHRAGAKNFRTITKHCANIGIKYLTVYAFSTENWKRPENEINALMDLFKSYLEEAIRDFKDEDIVVRFIGDKTAFSPELQALIKENEECSKDRTGMVLNIAMNYGGRDEIVRAARNIAKMAASGEILPDDVNEQLISSNLYTANQPDPDLIIRPSGEYRISNFLLWQSAYAEYVILDDVLWPDFTKKMLEECILEYARRNRRFGSV
ncbi:MULTISPECIES: isoprenyl transferase [unclassified Ruminococcus]|uniref:isoprenyl transferase n=1 Tax=unclassified Ruminococcus TaxID=2608920 RepID=UPI0021090F87|nr:MULTISPECIES: isoprenyl transferase [unclassified Ruminococcus]MCQ4021864.1 isoprenyl transferase [Ruminococcus sp. zg-924]MCQ4114309.1 isoprenyl transferase [Ruminococcus sp. zg-921]